VILTADGAVRVQRIRTGRESEAESKRPIYALLRRGAQAQYPRKSVVVETFYLSTGNRVVIDPKGDEALLAQYAEAIAAIEEGKFHPDPSPRTCPKCQCYFMCQG
jgi:DNA helicase-2/ATP-dependent DNA helicase PcrA